MEDSYCQRELSSPRPASSLPCQGQCEGIQWQYGGWSACSQSCGRGGAQTRQATCYDQRAGQPVEKEKCELRGGEALVSRECEAGDCPGWEAGAWSACSVTCGQGRSVREVSCQRGGARVEAGECEGLEEPGHSRPCSSGQQCGLWRPGEWSGCSSECGPGLRTRTSLCVSPAGQTLPPGHCPQHSRPVNTSTCVVLTCDSHHRQRGKAGRGSRYHHLPRYRWKIGRWSDCSSPCGGSRSRVVACYDRVRGRLETDQARCGAVRRRPRETQRCGGEQCEQRGWRTGQWSQCSSSCGAGLRWRRVECLDQRTGGQLGPELCSQEARPQSEESCEGEAGGERGCSNPVLEAQAALVESEASPAQWRTGDWSPCSATCGGGLRTRQVDCLQQPCRERERPHSEDSCNPQPCPAWNTGQWGGCDSGCGGGRGRARRLVRCQDHLGQTLPGHHCASLSRPPDSRLCSQQQCSGPSRAGGRKYLWRVGQWGQVTED